MLTSFLISSLLPFSLANSSPLAVDQVSNSGTLVNKSVLDVDQGSSSGVFTSQSSYCYIDFYFSQFSLDIVSVDYSTNTITFDLDISCTNSIKAEDFYANLYFEDNLTSNFNTSIVCTVPDLSSISSYSISCGIGWSNSSFNLSNEEPDKYFLGCDVPFFYFLSFTDVNNEVHQFSGDSLDFHIRILDNFYLEDYDNFVSDMGPVSDLYKSFTLYSFGAYYNFGYELNQTFQDGYNSGYNSGYQSGYADGSSSSFSGPFDLIRSALQGPIDFLSLEIAPKVTIGTILLIPLSVAIIVFLLKGLVM